MYAIHIVALLASLASAVKPEKARHESSLIPRDELSRMTVQEAAYTCGTDQTISCCNKIEQGDDINKSDGPLAGVLNGALSELKLADQCSAISISACMSLSTHQMMRAQANFLNSDWCPGPFERPVHDNCGMLPEQQRRSGK